jgi:hypothetical protein
MSKTFIRNIVLVILLSLILFFVLSERSPFGNDNSSFAVGLKKDITRIEFSQGNEKLSLERRGVNWIVNGKHETRKSSIQIILSVLKEISIKSPVSSEIFRKEITEKGINPVNVRVYGKYRLLKSFLVYKTQSNSYGNIMKIRNKSKPYIVYHPGYEADIGSLFILNDLYWQPYNIFNLLPSEITSVSLENFADTSSSFSISCKNHKIVIADMQPALSGWDSSRVNRYFSYFAWIPFESWAFDVSGAEKRRIESEKPSFRITVTDNKDKTRVLILWEREKVENGIKTIDSDRMWGKTENINELFIVRYFDVDPILKKRSYFFP